MDDTIDLRQLIEALLRGKWVIAGITIVAMLVAGVVSFVVIEPTYEARATVVVTLPQRAREAGGTGWNAVVEQATARPETSMETLRVLATSTDVLSAVVERLQLDMTPGRLAGKVTAQVPKDTTSLQITVKDSDPVMAAEVANTLIDVFVEQVDRLNEEQAQGVTQFLEEQMAVEQQRLAQATAELKDFLQQPGGIDELERELSAKLTLLSEYAARKTNLQVERDAIRAEVAQAEQLVNSLPAKLTTTRVVADDAALHELAEERSGDSGAAGLRVESEAVNEAWVEATKLLTLKQVELSRVEAELEALDGAIASVEQELGPIRVALLEKQTVQRELQYQVDQAAAAMRTLSEKYREVSVSEAARIFETKITTVNSASVPSRPVAPRTKMNVAVAAVLGLMVGVGVVLFADYWRSSGTGAPGADGRAGAAG